MKKFILVLLVCLFLAVPAQARCKKCGYDSEGNDVCKDITNTWIQGWALCTSSKLCFEFLGKQHCFSKCKFSDPCPPVVY